MVDRISPAAALVRLPGAVLSHQSAAREWGIELVEDDGTDWLTIPRNHGRYAVPGWRLQRSELPLQDNVVRNDLRVTSVRRTLRDLATVLPAPGAVAAMDSALRQHLLAMTALSSYVSGLRGPGSRRVMATASLVDGRCGSVLESLARVLFVTEGLPGFRSQYVIADHGRFVARVDFCWPQQRLVVEVDGFAFHSDRADYRRDRERMNQLERLGWRVLRFTWEDVQSRPQQVVALIKECLRTPAAA